MLPSTHAEGRARPFDAIGDGRKARLVPVESKEEIGRRHFAPHQRPVFANRRQAIGPDELACLRAIRETGDRSWLRTQRISAVQAGAGEERLTPQAGASHPAQPGQLS
jgi:hypothetical protein